RGTQSIARGSERPLEEIFRPVLTPQHAPAPVIGLSRVASMPKCQRLKDGSDETEQIVPVSVDWCEPFEDPFEPADVVSLDRIVGERLQLAESKACVGSVVLAGVAGDPGGMQIDWHHLEKQEIGTVAILQKPA